MRSEKELLKEYLLNSILTQKNCETLITTTNELDVPY